MIRLRNILLVLSAAVLVASCGGNKSNVKIEREYDNNRRLIRETPYVNGVAHGMRKEYYTDGKLRLEAPFVNGKIYGTVKFYYPNGKVFSETPRTNGKIHGKVRKYYKNGKLHSETPYEWGVLLPGLVEFNQRGDTLPQPTLILKKTSVKKGAQKIVTITASLSNGFEGASYSMSNQVNDKMVFTAMDKENGKGVLRITMPANSMVQSVIGFRAEYVTSLNNRCLVENSMAVSETN